MHGAQFHLIGFSVFLSLKEQSRGFISKGYGICAENIPLVSARFMRSGKCIGVLIVSAFFLAVFARDRMDLAYFLIFLFPFFLLLGHLFLSDLRGYRTDKTEPCLRGNLKNCYHELLTLLSGPVFFSGLVVLYYYVVNGLDELIFDTFALPMAMKFYKPMQDSRLHAALAAAAVLLIMALIDIGKRLQRIGGTEKGILGAVSLLLILFLPAVFHFKNLPLETLRMRAIYVVPPATLLLTSYFFVTTWRKEQLSGVNTRKTLFLGLVFIFACQGLIMGFPRTDTTHIRVNSTAIFILISFLLWRLYAAWGVFVPKCGKILAPAFIAVCLVMLAAPYVWSMKPFYYSALQSGDSVESGQGATNLPIKLDLDFPRAQGLDVPLWSRRQYPQVWADIVKIARFVRENTESGESIFLLCEPQIIYFLSERDSFLRKENYFVHLAAMGLIDRVDAVRLPDEEMLEKLIEAKPRFIIQTPGGAYTRRIAALWPKTAEYIEKNYTPAKRLNAFCQILRPRSQHQADVPSR